MLHKVFRLQVYFLLLWIWKTIWINIYVRIIIHLESPWKRCSTVFKKIQHLNFTEYKIVTKAISYWESALPIMCPLDFLEILTSFMTIFWRVIKNNFKLIQIKYVRPSNSLALEGLQALNLRSGSQLSKKLFLFASVKTH